MITLYHAPVSRSSAIAQLVEELGVQDKVTVQTVSIPRMDGTGSPTLPILTRRARCRFWSTMAT
jgi:hypothetical protein